MQLAPGTKTLLFHRSLTVDYETVRLGETH